MGSCPFCISYFVITWFIVGIAQNGVHTHCDCSLLTFPTVHSTFSEWDAFKCLNVSERVRVRNPSYSFRNICNLEISFLWDPVIVSIIQKMCASTPPTSAVNRSSVLLSPRFHSSCSYTIRNTPRVLLSLSPFLCFDVPDLNCSQIRASSFWLLIVLSAVAFPIESVSSLWLRLFSQKQTFSDVFKQTDERKKRAFVLSFLLQTNELHQSIFWNSFCVCVGAWFSMPNEFISCWLRCYVTTANSECPICYRRRNIHALTSSFTHPRP